MAKVGNSSERSIMTKRNTENKCFAENIVYTDNIVVRELLLLFNFLNPWDRYSASVSKYVNRIEFE